MRSTFSFFVIALTTTLSCYAQPQRIERNVARSKATLAQAISETSWSDGDLVTTQGYSSANDGGANTYRYYRTGRSVLPIGTVDGGFYIAHGSDGYLKAVDQTVADIKKFGAVGDGSTDDTARFIAAIATGKDVVIPDNSVYRIATGITLQTGQSIRSANRGVIKYTPSGAYGLAVTLDSGCSIEGVTFQGNGVATGDTGNVVNGAAIAANSKSNLSVKNCRFIDWKFSDANASVIGFNDCRGVNVSDNFFDRSNDNGTAIAISYRVADAIISGNISYGRFDVWAAISAVGGDSLDAPVGSGLKDTEHHIITDNIAICGGGEPDATGREGLNIHYAGGSTYAVISSNVFVNWNRHGVYMRGDGTQYTGPTIVSENIIRYCGGGSTGPGADGYQYNSGIKCESTLPASIIDNIIEHAGYNTDGTERASSSSAGIEIARGAARLTVGGNKVTTVKGMGICISPTTIFVTADPDLDMVDIEGNSVKGTTGGGITFSNNISPSTLAIGPVTIRGNDVQLTATSGFGIGLLSTNLSGTAYQATITNNKIRGAGILDSQYGIAIGSGSEAIITHNVVEDCQNGIGWRTVFTSSTSISYLGHRKVGETWWADFNQFKNCTNAFGSAGTGATDQMMVGTNNRFQGCTNTLWGAAYYGSRAVAADKLGINTTGEQTFRFYLDAIPTGGAYYVGDRVSIRSPTAAGGKEYVCTTAGSPGTWSPAASLIDEDDFSSNSATAAPSQQSVKAYVDARHGHAQISIEDNATATTVASTQSDWSAKSQFVGFGSNFADSSNATPDHTNDHITLTSAGVWEVSCVVTISGSVVSDLWELALWKNNGATQVSTKQGLNIRGAGLTYEKQVTISGLVDASANDTIELWVQRTNGTGTLTITNAVMTAKKVSD